MLFKMKNDFFLSNLGGRKRGWHSLTERENPLLEEASALLDKPETLMLPNGKEDLHRFADHDKPQPKHPKSCRLAPHNFELPIFLHLCGWHQR